MRSPKKLDRYNQFYRIVGEPLILMDIEDFILDVELLENTNPNVEAVDTLPFMKFIQHFKKNLVWERHIRKE
jgi:hypothetical protein